MGKRASDWTGYSEAVSDYCCVSSETREAVECADRLDSSELAELSVEQLHDAIESLYGCKRWQCEIHSDWRHAIDALEHAYSEAVSAEEDESERDAECCRGGCNRCLGL